MVSYRTNEISEEGKVIATLSGRGLGRSRMREVLSVSMYVECIALYSQRII